MPGVDFHTKLLRFELSFDSLLDDDFQVDVKKSRILLDEDLRKKLLDYAAPFKAEANKRYRKKQTTSSAANAKDVHSASNTVIKSAEEILVNPDNVVAVSDSEVQISNRFGVSIAPYNIHDGVGEGDIFIETVEDLQDNLLWSPALIDKKRGVQLNANHEFYKRFYANNQKNKDAIHAMDYVFYALAQAETDAYGEEAVENLEEARYQASRQLRKLAKYLPDASIEDIEGVDE